METTKDIHIAFYEMGILMGIGIPVLKIYETMLATHGHQPEVAALSKELIAAWKASGTATTQEEQVDLCLTPLAERAASSKDFALLLAYSKTGMMIGSLHDTWKAAALVFLMREKLRTGSPTETDLAMGAYLLSVGGFATIGDTTSIETILSWSEAPEWKTITSKTLNPALSFPEEWWNTFVLPNPVNAIIPSLLIIEQTMLESGTFGTISEVLMDWNAYTIAYEQITSQ